MNLTDIITDTGSIYVGDAPEHANPMQGRNVTYNSCVVSDIGQYIMNAQSDIWNEKGHDGFWYTSGSNQDVSIDQLNEKEKRA